MRETGGTDNSLSDPKIPLKVLESIIDDITERSLIDEELFYLYAGIVDNPNATEALIRTIAYSPRVEGEIDGLGWSDMMYEPILRLFWALMANKHTSGGILRNFANIQNNYWREDFAERVISHPNVWDETLAEIAKNEQHSENVRELARAKLNTLTRMRTISFEEFADSAWSGADLSGMRQIVEIALGIRDQIEEAECEFSTENGERLQVIIPSLPGDAAAVLSPHLIAWLYGLFFIVRSSDFSCIYLVDTAPDESSFKIIAEGDVWGAENESESDLLWQLLSSERAIFCKEHSISERVKIHDQQHPGYIALKTYFLWAKKVYRNKPKNTLTKLDLREALQKQNLRLANSGASYDPAEIDRYLQTLADNELPCYGDEESDGAVLSYNMANFAKWRRTRGDE